jgi:hypothetical protein
MLPKNFVPKKHRPLSKRDNYRRDKSKESNIMGDEQPKIS